MNPEQIRVQNAKMIKAVEDMQDPIALGKVCKIQATNLFIDYTELQKAGFSSEQAFQILLVKVK